MSMALIMSALGALAVTSGIALAAAHPQGPGDHPAGDMTRAQAAQKAAEHFARMDANKDGKLDAADRTAHHAEMASEMFARVDADRNGSISREEWNAGAARMAEGREGPRHALKMQRPAMMMMRADTDGDRAITAQEFEAGALARFDRADANRDGTLTAAERQQAHAGRHSRR